MFALTACGKSIGSVDQEVPAGMTEAELNAPIDGSDPNAPQDATPVEPEADTGQVYFFPKYSSSFMVTETIYNRAQKYYDQHWKEFTNRRYVVLIDFGLRSNQKRFVLLDLKTGKAETHNTSVGKGSDPDGDGIATKFSNTPESNKSSLGFYKTLATYTGKHGRSLRLDGLSSTNSNALSRAIVIHGADYISDLRNVAGRSLGCPALDNAVVQGVIDKIKGGAMMLIATSRTAN